MNCRICGTELPGGAMFCGECGSSSTATPATRKRPDPRPSDTTIIQRLPPQPTVISVPIDTDAPINTDPPIDTDLPIDTDEPPTDLLFSSPPAAEPPTEVTPATPAARPVAESASTSAPLFELQFSTGERATVGGTGLIGRRPLPQPSEVFDHLIQVSDTEMSVSKSHLEFGQQDGEFWVSDRFSGNGTIIRRPGEAALRCEPGRRYRVPRGTRVDIADQFFVLR
ncbi:FHA domain-containing protein [Cryobacterium sp. Sr8]|uniref:FHA domain-containing protein n=1 Tax=Cryobacterium sp. Sr8 TaxID=1259203 RepID=UPI00106ACC49|nr:FHA domain-containing protein [Cryobacterium sp. Sr8]TFD74241.1 FHA domain-containing protein [Cryobacterium sp. Sr8]